MRPGRGKILAVVGAGPKGIAVAVKAKVLAEFGVPIDRVVLIERNGVAANWSGNFGYTNGEMKLGTSPEKDVVFPVETDVGDARLNARLRQRLMQFSWNSFLVQTDRYSDWIDRGRPAPCHLLWATYLKWISEQLAPEVSIVNANVVSIDLSTDGKRWELSLNGTETLEADRLMLTGPGKTRTDLVRDEAGNLPPGTYDLESFWGALKAGAFLKSGRLAIVGAGENAASALGALSRYAPELKVDVITPNGFVSTRAEGYYENQFYSQPERNGWKKLTPVDRVDFIKRTDLGVFSTDAMRLLNEQTRHTLIPGRMIGLESDGRVVRLQLSYGQQTSVRDYDQVILGTGFDQTATLKAFFSASAFHALEAAIDSPLNDSVIAGRIQDDLSVAGMTPALHLPMLANLMQGPGFSNLSCLGLLSDRVML